MERNFCGIEYTACIDTVNPSPQSFSVSGSSNTGSQVRGTLADIRRELTKLIFQKILNVYLEQVLVCFCNSYMKSVLLKTPLHHQMLCKEFEYYSSGAKREPCKSKYLDKCLPTQWPQVTNILPFKFMKKQPSSELNHSD